ncbi:MAG TPA: hypothetical protein VGD80_05725, partial [Kofleriaceae bacterium]
MRALAAAAFVSLCCAAGSASADADRAQAPRTPAGSPTANSSASTSSDPPAPATRGALIDALGASDAAQVERAVAAIERVAAPDGDPDALFAAARACEDRLLDPGRAAAIYERIVGEHGAARVAAMAARRSAALRELIGPHGESAAQAAELARLIATADALPAEAVIERGEELAAAAWPGAPAAGLWLAEWLRR